MVSRAAGGTEFEDADAALHQACFLMVVWSTEVSPYASPKCPSGEQLPDWIRRLFLHPIPLEARDMTTKQVTSTSRRSTPEGLEIRSAFGG